MIRTPSHKPASQPDRYLFFGLLVLLLWMPLPWGSHSDWGIEIMGIVVCALLAGWFGLAAAGAVEVPRGRGTLVIPLLIWALWLAFVALQALPCPPGLLAQLSPQSVGMQRPIAALAGQHAIGSLSIAPGITWTKWQESWVYFGLYLLTLLTLRSDGRLRLLLGALALSGLAQATYGSLMVMSGSEYGWLARKHYYLGSATGTFVNRNHFAGYLELTAAAAVALVLSELRSGAGDWSWRKLLGSLLNLALSVTLRARLALLIMALGLVMSKSRMGNLAFFAAVGIGGLLYMLLHERKMFFKAAIFFSSVVVIDVLVVSQYFGLEKVIERMDATRPQEEGRVTLLREIAPVLEAYAPAGSGLGTFSLAYEPFRSEKMTEYMTHAHNDYIEFFVETGIVGAGLLGALLLWHALHALRVLLRRRHRLRVATCAGVLIAMLALGVHATAEFNFQIPAVAGTFVVLLGAAASCSSRSRRARSAAAPAETGEAPENALSA